MSATGQGKGWDVLESQDRARFEQLVLPHIDAAFNLSRWLLRSRSDSEDVAQEAIRALAPDVHDCRPRWPALPALRRIADAGLRRIPS